MVQVDIFWAYAFGSCFALMAHRQLAKEKSALQRAIENQDLAAQRRSQWWNQPAFISLLLFISILFAPSGIYLVWAFPDWETMQVAISHESLPPWLVTAFAITNVTQAILGYLLTRWHLTRGQSYAAFQHFAWSYLLFFFILVHGWDGTGYQRFFSANREQFLSWGDRPWHHWLSSDVALTLYGMGVFLLPALFWLSQQLLIDGLSSEGKNPVQATTPSLAQVAGSQLGVAFICGLLPAIAASLLIRSFGWLGGLALFTVVAAALVKRGSLFDRFHKSLLAGPTVTEPLENRARLSASSGANL